MNITKKKNKAPREVRAMRAPHIRDALRQTVESSIGGELCNKVTYECDFDADAWPKGLQPSQLNDAIKRLLSHVHECSGENEEIKIRIEQIAKRNDAVLPYARGYLMLYAEGRGMTILMAY
jgi:hypothetical protein